MPERWPPGTPGGKGGEFAPKNATATASSKLTALKTAAKKATPPKLGDFKVARNGTAAVCRDLNEWAEKAPARATDNENFRIKADDNLGIVRQMSGYTGDADDRKALRAVSDASGTQAVAIAEMMRKGQERYMKVHFLATNPANIPGAVEGATPRRGSGTAMIAAIVQESVERGGEGRVRLQAINSALPFYEKLGFVREPSKHDDDELTSMVLSPEAAQAVTKMFEPGGRYGRATKTTKSRSK